MKVRREEEAKFEKIVLKCKEKTKLHYVFINKKLKRNEGMERLKENNNL